MSLFKQHQYRYIAKTDAPNTPTEPVSVPIPTPQPPTAPVPKPKKVVVPMVKTLSSIEPPPAPSSSIASQSESIPSVQTPPEPQFDPAFFDEKKAAFDEQLEQERQTTLQSATDKGYADGYEAGKKEGLTLYQDRCKELLTEMNAIGVEKQRVISLAKREILNLSTKIAETILKSELSFNQAVSLNIVSEALSKITDKDNIIIRVNHLDYEYISLNQAHLKELVPDIKHLQIIDDESVSQGGCIIETNLGYIDSTIETKIDSIKQALMAVLDDETQST